ncbi:MAG: hypothetical protein FWH04_01095 [Oscillospiraceae bacterium]|nr:hypothetical protein [Oscillospiraceae bacterium]
MDKCLTRKSAINFLKFMLCVVIYGAVYILVMGFMPFSQAFTDISEQIMETQTIASTLTMLLPIIWNCFTAYYIIRRANIGRKKLSIRLLCVMFFVVYFVPQALGAESADAHGMPWYDFMLITIPGLVSLLTAIPLMVKFFYNKDMVEIVDKRENPKVKDTVIKIGIGGLIVAGTYIIFLLTVQRNFEEYRMFYAETAWMQAAHGENIAGIFYPLFSIPFLRGVINGLLILPLLTIITKSKVKSITAICLVLLAPAVAFAAPNPLFPDTVRLLLTASMIITMLLLSIFIGNVMWKNRH